jgi:23S rRNA (uracil1939-C5)-methyltransferase
MPLAEDEQRRWKRQLVLDALSRIARLDEPRVDPLLCPSNSLGYRNRVEFSAGAGRAGNAAIGLWGEIEGERSIVDIATCPLQAAEANELLARIRRFVARRPEMGAALVEQGPFRVLIRSTSAGQRLVGLWGTARPFPYARELAKDLFFEPGTVDSVVRFTARPGRRGGIRCETLEGAATLTERLGEFEFELPPASFVQVNPAGGDALIRLVLELAGRVDGHRVLDLFAGVGAFGLHLARHGAKNVVVCDADREGIEAGKATARRLKGEALRFVHATVGDYLRTQPEGPWNLVVANPPRAGFGRGIAQRILGLSPGRLIVVSCDPPTLARDLRPFLAAGYTLERVVPVDLFPQTPHVETVVLLRRPI